MSKLILASTLIGALAASPVIYAASSASASQAMTPAQKTEVEGIVHNYLMQNPEVILEAVRSLQQKEFDKMQNKTKEVALKESNELFHQSQDPIAGNANGKITLVEFFDYQCPHCVDMIPVIAALIKGNNDLRVVYKEFPIRGAVSRLASKAALAANMQGKYLVLHEALMKDSQSLSEEKIYKIAQSIGLDVAKLKADMNSAAVDQIIKNNYQLAQKLQLAGTPAMFLAKTNEKGNIEFIPGQVDQSYLQSSIKKIAR